MSPLVSLEMPPIPPSRPCVPYRVNSSSLCIRAQRAFCGSVPRSARNRGPPRTAARRVRQRVSDLGSSIPWAHLPPPLRSTAGPNPKSRHLVLSRPGAPTSPTPRPPTGTDRWGSCRVRATKRYPGRPLAPANRGCVLHGATYRPWSKMRTAGRDRGRRRAARAGRQLNYRRGATRGLVSPIATYQSVSCPQPRVNPRLKAQAVFGPHGLSLRRPRSESERVPRPGPGGRRGDAPANLRVPQS